LVVIAIMLVVVASIADQANVQNTAAPPGNKPESLQVRGVPNAFRLGPRLYSGAEPEGDAAFAALAGLGLRTIISVDGAKPNLDAAKKHGLRYVHIPVGYDGITKSESVRLVHAIRSLPGPVFVHCHHGKHRGPTAAAICAIVLENWNRDRAIDWLNVAGTSPEYPGLFSSVREFKVPSERELSTIVAAPPERAEIPAFVEAMVQLDKHWDEMKAVEATGFKPPPSHPDLVPSRVALQVVEDFRELLRLGETKAKGETILELLRNCEQKATALHAELKARVVEEPEAALTSAFRAVEKGCADCHRRYRNTR
jgi:protein tyrosine phosphatase (PTP) superfamily phosphohydrolase (DUF442 family)